MKTLLRTAKTLISVEIDLGVDVGIPARFSYDGQWIVCQSAKIGVYNNATEMANDYYDRVNPNFNAYALRDLLVAEFNCPIK